ncbi:hypothetical protein HYPSUDRAFT_143764, partial [Hypholoma sublateritium FD-334 SS-4]
FGNYFRPCGHFVKAYYSGETVDCKSKYCALSTSHIHTAPNCGCPKNLSDERRIQSMFHTKCDECKAADPPVVRRTGRT